MKTFFIALFGATQCVSASLVGPLVGRAQCNEDNCLRAVAGTAAGTATLASRIAECSSLLKATYYPPGPIVTVFITATVTSGYVGNSTQGIITGTGVVSYGTPPIPYYATDACTSEGLPPPGRYTSACLCAGVTVPTVTAASAGATTIVSTILVTGKASASPTSSSSASKTFIIVAVATDEPDTYLYDQQFQDGFGYYSHLVGFAETVEEATPFDLDYNLYAETDNDPTYKGLCALEIVDAAASNFVSEQNPGPYSDYIYFNTPAVSETYGYPLINFTEATDPDYLYINDVIVEAYSLTAVNPTDGFNVLSNCEGTLDLIEAGNSTDVSGNSCFTVYLYAIYDIPPSS